MSHGGPEVSTESSGIIDHDDDDGEQRRRRRRTDVISRTTRAGGSSRREARRAQQVPPAVGAGGPSSRAQVASERRDKFFSNSDSDASHSARRMDAINSHHEPTDRPSGPAEDRPADDRRLGVSVLLPRGDDSHPTQTRVALAHGPLI